MAGVIQTAIGQMLGALSGAAIVGKKLSNDERQARKEKQEEPEDKASKPSQEEAAKAYKIAQDRGATSTERIIFDEQGKPLGTYDELSVLISRQALDNYQSSRKRTKSAIQERRKLLTKDDLKEAK